MKRTALMYALFCTVASSSATLAQSPYYGGDGGDPAYDSGYRSEQRETYRANPARGRVEMDRRAHGLVLCWVCLGLGVTIRTSISSETAREGDIVVASVDEPVQLGDRYLPPGTRLEGQVTQAQGAHRLMGGGPADLRIFFNRLQIPNGEQVRIVGHVVGSLRQDPHGLFGKLESNRMGRTAVDTGVGAGLGAALGTAVGAIAGHGHGAGRGAWSGTAIGAGLGALNGVVLSKGKNIVVESGEEIRVQLDEPTSVALRERPYM